MLLCLLFSFSIYYSESVSHSVDPCVHLLGQQVIGRVFFGPILSSIVIMLQKNTFRADWDVPSVSDAFVDVLLFNAERTFADTAVDITAEECKVG